MSFIVLHKAFDPSDITSWRSLGFAHTEQEAKKIMRASTFNRGDLFTYVLMEHVSSIEENIQRLAVATSSTKISWAPASWIAEVQDTSWLYAYENAATKRLFVLLPKYDKLDALRVLYLCLKPELRKRGEFDETAKEALDAVEGYLFGSLPKQDLANIIKPLQNQISLQFTEHDVYLMILYICQPVVGNGDLGSYIQETIDVFCSRSFRGNSDDIGNRFREIVPLPVILLSLVEKTPLGVLS